MGAEREPPHPIEPLIPPGNWGCGGCPKTGTALGPVWGIGAGQQGYRYRHL